MGAYNGLERRLKGILGSDRVESDPEVLKKYSMDQSFLPPRLPQLAVYPETGEEVQQVVRLANVERFPVVPYSSGAIQQGSTIPIAGGVIVDFSRMNKIMDIDEVSRAVTIEPGVTFRQLQGELGKYGLRVCTAVGLPASASVLSSYLEFTPLYSWSKYGTWFLLPLEVILPTGEKMGTGSWAFANASPRGISPMAWASGLSRIFFGAQGTLGIATKGRIVVKNANPDREVYFIPCTNVAEVIGPLHRILRVSSKSIGEECFIVDRMNLLQMTSGNWPEGEGAGKEVSPWTVVVVLSGEEDEVKYQREDLLEILQQSGLSPQREVPGIADAGRKILEELMLPRGFYDSAKWAYHPIQFYVSGRLIAPVENLLGGLLKAFNVSKEKLGSIIVPVEKGRVYYCEYGLHRDKGDAGDTEKVRTVWFEAIRRLLELGVYFDRPYGPLGEMVYARTGLYHSMVKKFKDLFDPNGIMNLGRV